MNHIQKIVVVSFSLCVIVFVSLAFGVSDKSIVTLYGKDATIPDMKAMGAVPGQDAETIECLMLI